MKKFEGIANTLFVPLVARIAISKEFPEYFYDPKALELEGDCFYAAKMGEQYLDRYKKHFKNPVIHHFCLEHEELLVCYPKLWAMEIKGIMESVN